MTEADHEPKPLPLWWLLPLLIAAGVWRFWLAAQTFVPDFDTGTVALMVQHILDGERPLFFYGQNYMGAFEAYVAAGLCRIAGYHALSLVASPILMSLAWMGGMILLLRACRLRRGLFLAALLLVFSGWMTERYMVSTYGGYATVMLCGVWSLWAAVRGTAATGHSRLAWLALWGLFGALGLWTHFLVAPFLLTGGLFMLWQHRHNLLAFTPAFVLGCIIAMHGLIPRLLTRDLFVANATTAWSLRPAHFAESLSALWTDNLPLLLFEGHLNEVEAAAHHPYLQAGLLLMLLAAALVLWKHQSPFALLTGLFSLIFLALYLPHSMSTLRAPRYLIPLMGLLLPLLAVGWSGFPQKHLRRIGRGLLLLWVLHQAQTTLHYEALEAPRASEEIKIRDRLIRSTREAGVTHSGMLGGLELRHRGQALTAHAAGSPVFTNVRDERYLPFTQAFLGAEQYGYTYQDVHSTIVANTLRALNAGWETSGKNRLMTAFRITPRRLYPEVLSQRILPGEIDGPAELNDGQLHTSLSSSTLQLTFERPVLLSKIWLMNAAELRETLPKQYRVEGQTDQGAWIELAPSRVRLCHAEVIGNRAVIDYYYGRMEHRFNGEKIQALRIEFSGNPADYAIGECWVFEDVTPGPIGVEHPRMRTWFAEQGVDTVWADLWVSTQLNLHSDLKTLPPYNPKFNETNQRRDFFPAASTGLVVEQGLESTIEQRFENQPEKNVIRLKQRFGAYTAYVFNQVQPPEAVGFYWDGRVLLKR